MGETIEIRNRRVLLEDDRIRCAGGGPAVTIPLEEIESCLLTEVPRFGRGMLKLAVVLVVAFGVGFILLALYLLAKSSALDILTKKGNYIIADRRGNLLKIKRRVDSYRREHGRAGTVEDDNLLNDATAFDRLEAAYGGRRGSSAGGIRACIGCGSRDLGMASVSDGGVPGASDIQGKYVCRRCGHVALPLEFPGEDEYAGYIAARKAGD